MSKRHDNAIPDAWYEGRDVGHREGYQDGRSDGDNHEMGYQAGYEIGYQSGLSQIDGYQKGYAQHAADAEEAEQMQQKKDFAALNLKKKKKND